MLPRFVALLVVSALGAVACAPEFTIAGTGGASATSSSSSGAIHDAGVDATACEASCAEKYAVGYAAFVCDGLQYCGCPTTAPCSSECGKASGCTVSAACGLEIDSVPAACVSCLETQYEMTTGCAVNAENTCKGNTQCAALLGCFATCFTATPG